MPSTTITKVAGLALGIVACSVLLVAPRISRPAGALDAKLTLTASPTGEVGVTPVGTVLDGARLLPGAAPRRAALVLRNQTIVPLAVRLRGRPATGDLDEAVRVRITAAGSTLFDGPLRALRSGTRPLAFPPGAARRLRLTAVLTGADRGGYEGRTDEVALDILATQPGATP